MEKPWIGIPTRFHAKSETYGQIRHYLDAVIWAGGIPLLIPTINDKAIIREYAARVDGVLLPGSPTDIAPELYSAAPHAKLGDRDPERDVTDLALLEHAEGERLPLLGICFGVQSLNVYRGGTLIQDIDSEIRGAQRHETITDTDPPTRVRHRVKLERESLMSVLAGKTEVDVNSSHHQSVERVGRDLKVVARAPDGVVEAVEDATGRFVVGVQWHPEKDWQNDPLSQGLFKRFIEAARGE